MQGEVLDLNRPVGVVLTAVLHWLADSDDPHRIVRNLAQPLAGGSHLAISHYTADFAPTEVTVLTERITRATRDPFVARDLASVTRFLDQFDILEPGVVRIDGWRPEDDADTDHRSSETRVPALYAAVGRKP